MNCVSGVFNLRLDMGIFFINLYDFSIELLAYGIPRFHYRILRLDFMFGGLAFIKGAFTGFRDCTFNTGL